MSRTIVVIEARMSSTRLPGKVMLPLGEVPVIEFIVNRLKKCNNIDEICVATTSNIEDQPLADHFREKDIIIFRGSDWNVLDRVLNAAEVNKADVVVEITGDCPFVDPELVDYMIELLINNKLEYVSNNFTTTFADGFDIQVYYLSTLKKMAQMELSNIEREHVTMKIRQNPDLFKTLNLVAPLRLRRPNYSVTLDTQEDYRVINQVYDEMSKLYGRDYGIIEITDFLDNNPEIVKINGQVQRKGYS